MTRAELLRALHADLTGDAALEAALGGPGKIVGLAARERPEPPYIALGVGPEEAGLHPQTDGLDVEMHVVAEDVFTALEVVDALDAALQRASRVTATYTGHGGVEAAEELVVIRAEARVMGR